MEFMWYLLLRPSQNQDFSFFTTRNRTETLYEDIYSSLEHIRLEGPISFSIRKNAVFYNVILSVYFSSAAHSLFY